jgi:DNA mismatch repair protein MutS
MSTGTFRIGEFEKMEELQGEILRLSPREFIVPEGLEKNILKSSNLFNQSHSAVNEYENWIFDCEESKIRILNQFNIVSLRSLGIADFTAGISAAGALLYYLKDNLNKSLDHLKKPLPFSSSEFMALDRQTIKNLELIHLSHEDRQIPTLYKTLDETVTPMGARLLSMWIKKPLFAPDQIRTRLDAVEEVSHNQSILRKLKDNLKLVKDLERLLARINCGTPSARDLVALGNSLQVVPSIQEATASLQSSLICEKRTNLFALKEVTDKIELAFVEYPPLGVRDGGIINKGYNQELDELHNMARSAKDWIAALQASEMKKTGIRSLKIKYNRVFGYYIEITKANLSMVPDRYIRKQTLVNAERFTIPELKEYEEKILSAEEQAKELEYKMFEEIRTFVLQFIPEIQSTADAVAHLDTFPAFAAVAIKNKYCNPEVSDSPTIHILGGRHPIVEQMIAGEPFIENDVFLDNSQNQILIITGPNMAGKSTFIRQVALIVLMAQIGAFVPARKASIGMVDRVFTRIGAADNLAQGESTFMVEMNETANILHNATSKSLLIFDEIGRGTSTFDGVSIAWSVCEYLHQKKGFRPKTLFATHYHELTELAEHREGIKNFNVTVKELEDGILFLRKVVPGGADKSYGIHVGRLAGLPIEIITRAQEILLCLEQEKISEMSITEIIRRKRDEHPLDELPLFKTLKHERVERDNFVDHVLAKQLQEDRRVIEQIKGVDPHQMTPLDALIKIAQWKKELEED